MLYPFFMVGTLMIIFGILSAVAGFDLHSGRRCHGWAEYRSNGLEMLKTALLGAALVVGYVLLLGIPEPE
jgi:uncharacterized membrane protein HdeD (DUF308 family)